MNSLLLAPYAHTHTHTHCILPFLPFIPSFDCNCASSSPLNVNPYQTKRFLFSQNSDDVFLLCDSAINPNRCCRLHLVFAMQFADCWNVAIAVRRLHSCYCLFVLKKRAVEHITFAHKYTQFDAAFKCVIIYHHQSFRWWWDDLCAFQLNVCLLVVCVCSVRFVVIYQQ